MCDIKVTKPSRKFQHSARCTKKGNERYNTH